VSSLSRALTFALLVPLALLPLAYGGRPVLAWGSYAMAVGLLLALSAFRRRLHGVDSGPALRRISLGSLTVGFLVLAIWFAVQGSGITPADWHHPIWGMAQDYMLLTGDGAGVVGGSISVAPDRTHHALVRWLALGATFWLVAAVARDRDAAWTLVRGLALIGLAYAVYGLAIQFGGWNLVLWHEKVAYRDVVTSTFINRNSYATFAGLAALCWLAWFLQALPAVSASLPPRERMLRIAQGLSGKPVLLLAGFVVVLTSVLLTLSRAGSAATLVGLVVFVTAFAAGRGGSRRRLAALPVGVILAILVGFSADGVFARLETQGMEDAMRARAAAIMTDAVADSPIAGFGRGAFEPAFDLYRDPALTVRFDRGHQDYLETLFELGVPAGLLLLALPIILGLVYMVGIRTRKRDTQLPALGLAALSLVGVHALFDFSLQLPAVAMTFTALAALAWAQSFSSRGSR